MPSGQLGVMLRHRLGRRLWLSLQHRTLVVPGPLASATEITNPRVGQATRSRSVLAYPVPLGSPHAWWTSRSWRALWGGDSNPLEAPSGLESTGGVGRQQPGLRSRHSGLLGEAPGKGQSWVWLVSWGSGWAEPPWTSHFPISQSAVRGDSKM